MLLTLIRKEMMHHLLSVRFIVLLLMCLLLVPLTLSINYQHYRQNLVDYQEAVKLANIEEKTVNPKLALEPEIEISKLFLKPTPLSVFADGLGDALPSYLGMTRNGIIQGAPALVSDFLSYLLGHLDFLFLVGTVFSLLALLFTFDAVAGEREAGTLRITLSNPIPRDLFLWSKLIGGYVVFIVAFLVSLLFGLLILVWQGFPLGEPGIFPRVFSITLASLLYIGVFFAIGTVISIYLDSPKTALIFAFTVWVFAVLITPRLGFLAAKVITPTRTSQSVYMEKTAMRDNFDVELKEQKTKFYMEVPPDEQGVRRINDEISKKVEERMTPLEEEYRSKFQNRANKLDRDYKRETERQEQVGEMFSRITPTSSLVYLTTNLTQTGKLERSNYFQTGDRYYEMLRTDFFSKILDHTSYRVRHPRDNVIITQPPSLATTTLGEVFRQSAVDVLLLCFFAVVLTTVAFLKFFRSDI
ncbi:ABC transporter permease subunit [Candidatus Poribacteria bacterium]|nr:ABC transporter permease subunit [Candidatus Poribacteria bacterium]MYF56262.1 ABC transporter permease subunit [Candidatus Poribacteria bacterium]MYI94610.1 ABC transporter permease subunit [Candidatus Poribacteria bacterium]